MPSSSSPAVDVSGQQLLAVDALWSTKTGQVLFLEAGSVFADFLCHLLRQPLSKVADFLRITTKQTEAEPAADHGSSASPKRQRQMDGNPAFVHLLASMCELEPSLFRPEYTPGAGTNKSAAGKASVPADGMSILSDMQHFTVTCEDIFMFAGHNSYVLYCDRNRCIQCDSTPNRQLSLEEFLKRISEAARGPTQRIRVEDVFHDCISSYNSAPITADSNISLHGQGVVSAGTAIERANQKLRAFQEKTYSLVKMFPFAGDTASRPSISPPQVFRDNLQFLISPRLTISPSTFVGAFSLLTAAKADIGDLRSTRISLNPALLARMLTNMMSPDCENVFDGLFDAEELKKTSRAASMCGDEPFTEVP